MSMYGGHRGMGAVPPSNGGGRLSELLDQIRSEFESQMRASENYEHQSKCIIGRSCFYTFAPPPPSPCFLYADRKANRYS